MKKVAILGTVGVPAAYGGFETLVENIIGENCSAGIEYTVFCSSKDCPEKLSEYKGAKLKYVPLHANGVQSIIYDGISMLKALFGYDAVVVLGVSGGIFMPLFKLFTRAKFIVNIDGMEWKRAKWGKRTKQFLHFSEKLAVKSADVVVGDNQAIVDYIATNYGASSELIAYGGDHVLREVDQNRVDEIFKQYGVEDKKYAISLCRIEPENNCEMILKAFSERKERLLFIGNWQKSEYGRSLKEKYAASENITCIDAIYDLDTLYVLRSHSKFYIHGHSAGGTNPSLVEAMFCGCNILAFDVIYNRNTTGNGASYFANSSALKNLLDDGFDNKSAMFELAQKNYTWHKIAQQYESLY